MIKVMIAIILLIILVIIISCILTNHIHYKYYSKCYKQLKKLFFFNFKNEIICSYGKEFIWFVDDNDFKLYSGIFIFNNWTSYLDPYTFYWLIKYRRYANKNLRHLLNDKQL